MQPRIINIGSRHNEQRDATPVIPQDNDCRLLHGKEKVIFGPASLSNNKIVSFCSHLILSKSCQHVHQSYLLSSLRFVRECRHDGLQSCLIFLGGRRLAHQGRGVGNKAGNVHQTKVHCCVLTRAREHHARKHVNELITCLQALWKLVINVSVSHGKAVVMDIFNPGLKLVVLGNVII